MTSRPASVEFLSMFILPRRLRIVAPLLLAALMLLTQLALAIHASKHALTPDDHGVCEFCLAADANGAAMPAAPGIVPIQVFHEAATPLPSSAALAIVPPAPAARSPPFV